MTQHAPPPPPAPVLNNVQMQKIADTIKDRIDEYCATAYNDGHRTHLGASLIGDVCARRLWYIFRHVLDVQHSGRMCRLFNRGHREEDRWIEWLRGIGFQVWDRDENGEQFRVAAHMGHFGGGLDGVGKHSEIIPAGMAMLLEFKTHNTKSFTKLVVDKVKVHRPKHFRQMCVYGRRYGFRYAIYFAINKNDDDIYIEVVELDFALADELVGKAGDIIRAQKPPPRYSNVSTDYECKYCDFQGICHYKERSEKNCRSCVFAVAAAEKQWQCTKYNFAIPEQVIKTGCDSWVDIAGVNDA